MERKTRVLHVFSKMDRGGSESWVMNVFRRIDREKFTFDFLVNSPDPGAFDDEIRALGGRIIYVGNTRRPLLYARRFLTILKSQGPFDVVHSHVHYFSGYMLGLARIGGVPMRIAHSHNDFRRVDTTGPLPRRLYVRAARWAVKTFATAGIATSNDAASSLFGSKWFSDSRVRVIYCGIDLDDFGNASGEPTQRSELGVNDKDIVIGHVGRFHPQKNHTFLLDVFVEVLKLEPSAHLILIGVGPLMDDVRSRVSASGLDKNVHFLGSRTDVPRLMREVFDVFAFPSLYEGLGLAVLEAQAAGLPCVVSDQLPLEADAIDEQVYRMSLAGSASEWAKKIVCLKSRKAEREGAVALLRDGPFDIDTSVRKLSEVYSAEGL